MYAFMKMLKGTARFTSPCLQITCYNYLYIFRLVPLSFIVYLSFPTFFVFCYYMYLSFYVLFYYFMHYLILLLLLLFRVFIDSCLAILVIFHLSCCDCI